MTGKEMIIFILENDLTNVELVDDGNLLGCMSEQEAAVKFGVTLFTIRAWVSCGLLNHIKIGDHIYIPNHSENPKTKNISGGAHEEKR